MKTTTFDSQMCSQISESTPRERKTKIPLILRTKMCN